MLVVMTEASGERRKRSNRFSGLILYLALCAPPLFYGSREPVVVVCWCALLGAGLAIASPNRLSKGHFVLLGAIGFLAACFGFVLHEQLSEHPWIATPSPIWEKASQVLGHPLVPSVSIVRGEPYLALGPIISNALALLLGLIVGANSKRARKGIELMAAAGAAYAIYGILAFALDPTEILWHQKTAYIGSLTSTFINRNTAAAYFGSCSVAWLILLAESFRRALRRGPIEWSSVPHQLDSKSKKKILFRFGMMLVCVAAMFMTGSRGGVLISLLILVTAFLTYFRRDLPRGRNAIFGLLFCTILGFVFFNLFGGTIESRIIFQGIVDQVRLEAYRSTLKIIRDNPWFGTGLGTFPFSFPAYRSSEISMQGIWDLAHSTPLEFASEMGIPLTVLVTIAWIASAFILVRALRNRSRDVTAPLSALMISLLAILHSSIDFSLQISGYSIVIFATLGLGLSQSVGGKTRRRVTARTGATALIPSAVPLVEPVPAP
jgi:O-antigen ligase